MRLPVGLSVFVLSVAVLAGCLDAPRPGDVDPPHEEPVALAADWWIGAVPSSITHPDHDHSDPAHHVGLTTENFEVIGWDPLVTDRHGTTVSGMGCGGAVTRDDGRRLAVVNSISSDMAFLLADVTDPAAPFLVGEFYMPNAVIWDADIAADGRHVLVGAYPPGTWGGLPPTLPLPLALASWSLTVEFRDACTGATRTVGELDYLPYGPGLVLIGIQEPSEPTLEHWVPQPVIGPHSVGSHLVDGMVIATSSVTNLAHEASYYSFFEIQESPAGSFLEPLAVIRAPGHPPPGQFNGHVDVWVEKHPVTGATLAYLANWFGMYVYDMSDWRLPVEIGAWTEAGAVHTTFPFPELVGGRQLLIVGQEVGEPVDLPSGWMFLLDVTDPATPMEVGRWTLPVKPKWDGGGLQFSTHYARVLGDVMFVANYHGGLWAVDVADPARPLAMGLFVPDRPSPHSYLDRSWEPSVVDVDVDLETGVITTWDAAGGVYQLRFHPDVPAPRAPAWQQGHDDDPE